MTKPSSFFIRCLLTLLILCGGIAILAPMDYFKRLPYVDNLIGMAPVLIVAALCGMTIALVWKRHLQATTSTIVLCLLIPLFAMLFIPARSGNWFPMARTFDAAGLSAPSAEVGKIAVLPAPSQTVLSGTLPKLDGATALYPLYRSFANAVYNQTIPQADDTVVCTNTVNAYQSILSGDCDIIFVAGPSKTQREAAQKAGIDLVFTPVGKEAFVFIVGVENPIHTLSSQQLRDIYSGKTAKWSTLGWAEGGDIIAFQRPDGSGSQTGLQALMGDLPLFKPRPLPDEHLAGNGRMMEQISAKWNGVQPAIGYSYRYFATKMYPNPETRLLAVDGVPPTPETIANGSYPFSSEFYAVTRGQPSGNAEAFINWIRSDEGQSLVEQVGYVPIT